MASDKLAPADYDGDGKTDIAVCSEAEGNFYILNSSNNWYSVAVSLATNKIYIGALAGGVIIFDGATNTREMDVVTVAPFSLSFNPVTNKIYTSGGTGSITVIDGTNGLTTSVAVGTNPYGIAVNPVTNKIYVANFGGADVSVISGDYNTTATVASGTMPLAVAVNPVTNKIGERDPFWGPEEVKTYDLLDWIPDGDHSLKPRKSSGHT